MGICPNCGEWVDDGDICMCCGGSSSSGYEDNDNYGTHHSRRSSSFTPPDPKALNEGRLKSQKTIYEGKLKDARSAKNFDYKVKCYNEAIDYFEAYDNLSKRYGMKIDGMPDAEHMLSNDDIRWLSERHYKSIGKFSLFGTNENDELEKLLKKSGNVGVIRRNDSRYKAEREEAAKRYRIKRAKNERKWYFEHIEKANGFVDEDNIKKAMKEYRRADDCWHSYFGYDYQKDPQRDDMPKDKFTPDAVEHMMVIYVETHPILTSKKKQLKINREIVEMLDGKWDDKIMEADRKAQEIHDERQKRKQERVKKVGEAIGDAMIFADKLIKGFRK